MKAERGSIICPRSHYMVELGFIRTAWYRVKAAQWSRVAWS